MSVQSVSVFPSICPNKALPTRKDQDLPSFRFLKPVVLSLDQCMSAAHGNNIAGTSLSNLFGGLTSAAEILKIEQEIARHAQIIVDLKGRRNSLLPIFKLPVEILCRVFHFTRDAYMELGSYSVPFAGFRSRDLAWIAVTNVCQHWRNAALNDPSLWTCPPLEYSKWTAVMLERSRMAGLRIVISARSCVRDEFLSTLTSHIPHTAELTVKGVQKATVENLLTKFRTTASPMMQKLVIDGNPTLSYHGMVEFAGGNHDFARLHNNTFLGTTNLRHLSLMAIDIDWKSHLLSSLTTLSIDKVSDGARPTPTEFIDMLERLPGLKSLSLYNALPTSESLTNNANLERRRIPLPLLETLSIASEVTECEFFWNSITTSANLNNINGLATYRTGSSLSFSRFLAAIYNAGLPERLEASSRNAYVFGNVQTLTVRTMNQLSSLLRKNRFPIHRRKSNDPEFRLSIQVQNLSASPTYSAQRGNLIFTDFFNGMRWSRLSELDLTDLGIYNYARSFSQTLATTFGSLSGLRTVMVGPMCAKPLVDALLMNSDKDPAASPYSIIFPGLRYIQFQDVSFDENADEHAVEVDRLQDCLMSRHERGVDVYSIIVTCCRHFGEVDLGLLEEIVVDVDWDGEERGDTDDEVDEDEDEDEYEYYGEELDSDYYEDEFGPLTW